MKYRIKEGDVVDAVCAKFYGVGKFDIAAVYAANRGLAAMGTHPPRDTLIILPEAARIAPKAQTIRLWD